jgi:hypothetical protein
MPELRAAPMTPHHLARLVLVGAALALASCAYVPRHVDGIPTGEGWISLPLRSWLAEERIEPVAIAACLAPECGQRLAVGVFRATGEAAGTLAAVLSDPERLARFLLTRERQPDDRRRAVRLAFNVTKARAGSAEGFVASLGRADGTRRPAQAAAFGRRDGSTVSAVLVIGEDRDAVEALARRVAAAELGI